MGTSDRTRGKLDLSKTKAIFAGGIAIMQSRIMVLVHELRLLEEVP